MLAGQPCPQCVGWPGRPGGLQHDSGELVGVIVRPARRTRRLRRLTSFPVFGEGKERREGGRGQGTPAPLAEAAWDNSQASWLSPAKKQTDLPIEWGSLESAARPPLRLPLRERRDEPGRSQGLVGRPGCSTHLRLSALGERPLRNQRAVADNMLPGPSGALESPAPNLEQARLPGRVAWRITTTSSPPSVSVSHPGPGTLNVAPTGHIKRGRWCEVISLVADHTPFGQ